MRETCARCGRKAYVPQQMCYDCVAATMPKFKPLNEYIAEQERIPDRKAALDKARAELRPLLDKQGEAPTVAQIEEFRKEHYIPPQPGDEPWIAEHNMVLNYLCYRACTPLSASQPADKNYRKLLEESNLPIELAVEIADLVDAWQRLVATDKDGESERAFLDRLWHMPHDAWRGTDYMRLLAVAENCLDLQKHLARSARRTSDDEARILHAVLNQARATLLVSIKGTPEHLQSSLGRLNMACKAHWDWQTERIRTADSRASDKGSS